MESATQGGKEVLLPPEELSKKAYIKSLDEYRKGYRRMPDKLFCIHLSS